MDQPTEQQAAETQAEYQPTRPGVAQLHAPRTTGELAAAFYRPREEAVPEPGANALADAMYRHPVLQRNAEAAAGLQTARADYLGEPSAEVLAQRKDRPMQPFAYSAVDVAAALDPTLPAPVQEAIGREVREVAADIGYDAGELSVAVGLVSQVAAMDDAGVADMRQQALKELRLDHGLHAGEALGLARRMVAANPQLRRMLDDTGLGDHPRVIKAVIEAAQRQRAAGRLR